jgi:hypothetical protein
MNTVRKILIGASSAAILAGLATAANAQSNTSSASATVSASIIQPISITKVSNLSFGTIARPASGSSTITLANNTGTNPVSVTSGTAAVVTQGTRGEFTVTGDEGRQYVISGSGTSAFNLTHTNATDTISFTPTFSANGAGLSGLTGTLSGVLGDFGEGSQSLYAGGSFSVTNTTVTGAYSGTMNLTVTYQ